MAKTQYVSASKLIQDSLCPYKQKYDKYVENDILRFGKAVDAGITAWLKDGDFTEGFSVAASKNGLPLAEYIDRAVKCFETLQSASEDWLHIEKENILAIQSEDGEVEFYGNKFFQLDFVAGVWGLRGAMDYVDFYIDDHERTILRIIDWKTGFSDSDDLQLAVYAIAAWKKYSDFIPWDKIETRFFYLDRGGMSPNKTVWDKETLVAAYKYVEDRATTFLNRKEWPKTFNEYCNYCSLKGNCSEYKTALATVPEENKIVANKETMPEIVKQISKLKALEKVAKKAKEELETVRDEYLRPAGKDGIVIGEKLCMLKESNSGYIYDLPEIFSKTQELIGRAPFELMSFSSSAFTELVKDTKDKVVKKALQQIKKDHSKVKSTCFKYSEKIATLPEKIEQADGIEDATIIVLAENTKKIKQAGEIEDATITEAFIEVASDILIENQKKIDAEGVPLEAPVKAFLCAECKKITCDRIAPEGCPDCGNPELEEFENLAAARKSLIPENKPAIVEQKLFMVCKKCGCTSKHPDGFSGPCGFCKTSGIWIICQDKWEAEVKRDEVAKAIIENEKKQKGAN